MNHNQENQTKSRLLVLLTAVVLPCAFFLCGYFLYPELKETQNRGNSTGAEISHLSSDRDTKNAQTELDNSRNTEQTDVTQTSVLEIDLVTTDIVFTQTTATQTTSATTVMTSSSTTPTSFATTTKTTKTTTVTTMSMLSNHEKGYLYTLFYIAWYFLPGDTGKRDVWIGDYDMNGIDVMIIHFIAYDGGYYIFRYQNGELKKEQKSTIDAVSLNNCEHHSEDTISSFLLRSAQDFGYNANSQTLIDLTSNCQYVGYVKTKGIESNLNLRAEPSTKSNILAKLPNRLIFVVMLGFDNFGNPLPIDYLGGDEVKWVFISTYYNGQYLQGYLSTDYVAYLDMWI